MVRKLKNSSILRYLENNFIILICYISIIFCLIEFKNSNKEHYETMKKIEDLSEIMVHQYQNVSNIKIESIKNNYKETLENINESLKDNKITYKEMTLINNSYLKEKKDFQIINIKNIH